MERGYQEDFSSRGTAMFNVEGRERKAKTMIAVLQQHFGQDLGEMSVLNVGGSAGIIDNYLSQHFGSVIGIDIDEKAIVHAQNNHQRDNLTFEVGDFETTDYTKDIITSPSRYHAEYMMQPGTLKSRVATAMARYFFWLVPGYIWVLQKPGEPIG